ncbi:MAG: glycoside hydrolase family 130 protein [Mycobacteriales bacterium]
MIGLITRIPVTLERDPSRMLARLFVPGQELLTNTESRATGVLGRLLALPEDIVATTLQRVRDRYGNRHRDLADVLARNYRHISHRVPDVGPLSDDRRALIGAAFTQEFAIEGAALFNPSAVSHPDQSGVPSGAVRFLLTLRAVGEGHISSIEFRTGVAGPGPQLELDPQSRCVETGDVRPASYNRELFGELLTEQGADEESHRYLLSRLSAGFDSAELERALIALTGQQVTRLGASHTAELARQLAVDTYDVVFPTVTPLGQRVLWPHAPTESQGMEDVRLARFVDDDSTVTYRGTYTAYDGTRVVPKLLETTDFGTFRVTPLSGPAAKDKGLALFPRRVAGRHLALTRADRESNGIAFSDDGLRWGEATGLHGPTQPWELIQTGNCGPPLETPAGWLVLTHGVGPMREYAIGALLLELDDPTRVLGCLTEPLLVPAEDERDGYVPNVVYSCGALIVGDTLLVPYGASDATVRFAFVDLPQLLTLLTPSNNAA